MPPGSREVLVGAFWSGSLPGLAAENLEAVVHEQLPSAADETCSGIGIPATVRASRFCHCICFESGATFRECTLHLVASSVAGGLHRGLEVCSESVR